jgi:ectoine hydroxylase-related dioxygenase (phytanoyl-CoA dioxygenase family)
MIDKFFYNELNQALNYYKTNGVVIFKDLVPENLIKIQHIQINALISNQFSIVFGKNTKALNTDTKLIELAKKDDRYRERLYNVIQELPVNSNFGAFKNFYEISKKLGIKIPSLRASQIRVDMPNENRFLIPPHQEIKGIRSDNTLTFITAINDITNKMGTLRLAKGSFRLGPLQPEFSDNSEYQYVNEELYRNYPLKQVPLKKGETIMFNMYSIHGSCPNLTSKKIRWSHILRIEDSANMPYLNLDDQFEKFDFKEAR